MTTIRILVVHDRDYASEGLARLIQFESDMQMVGRANTGEQALHLLPEANPHVVLMDTTLPDMSGFEAARQITDRELAVQVVLMAPDLRVEVYQQAMMSRARDVIRQPPDADTLYSAVRQAYAAYLSARERTGPLTPPPEPAVKAPLGHMVAVYSGKGGVGCTTLATNLAVKLHNREKPAVLVDADLQFGDVCLFLDLHAAHSVADLAVENAEPDVEILYEVLAAHESGLRVLSAPPAINLAETVTAEQMRKILVDLRTRFGWVVVDTPSELNDLSLGIIEDADVVINVMTPDIPSIRRATVLFDLLDLVGLAADKVRLVLNMVEARRGITAQAISDNLKREIAAEVPYDRAAVLEAINRGQALVLSGKTRPFTRSVYELIGVIRQAVEAAPEPAG